MEFQEVIQRRHSIRSFLEKEIESEKIETIISLTNLAPSAGNLQAYEVFVIKNEELKRKLASAAYSQSFIQEAPVVFVFFADPERSASRYGSRGRQLYSLQDATIACTFAMLSAAALGLGSCWVGAFNDEEVKRICGVKKKVPIAILPVGYPKESGYPTSRRPIAEKFHVLE